jgi:hypothetical protein
MDTTTTTPASPSPTSNVLFGSVLLTLLCAASLTVAVWFIFFFFQLRYSFSFQGRFWTPTTSSALTTLRASTTFKGRLRLIRAALSASEEEVVERAGVEAQTHLRILRLCLSISLAACLPSLLFLLPLVATGSGEVAKTQGFKRFTLGHLDKDLDASTLDAALCAFQPGGLCASTLTLLVSRCCRWQG